MVVVDRCTVVDARQRSAVEPDVFLGVGAGLFVQQPTGVIVQEGGGKAVLVGFLDALAEGVEGVDGLFVSGPDEAVEAVVAPC